LLISAVLAVLLSGCGKQADNTPTEAIYQPTRSVATVPVPTKV